jgi:hypothetical protein
MPFILFAIVLSYREGNAGHQMGTADKKIIKETNQSFTQTPPFLNGISQSMRSSHYSVSKSQERHHEASLSVVNVNQIIMASEQSMKSGSYEKTNRLKVFSRHRRYVYQADTRHMSLRRNVAFITINRETVLA